MSEREIVAYAGLDRELLAEIERLRLSPSESRADILSRTLGLSQAEHGRDADKDAPPSLQGEALVLHHVAKMRFQEVGHY